MELAGSPLGYQITNELLMGNTDSVQTPKGLVQTGRVGLYMSHFIANYKGGRNESFMYGVDNKTIWYDYDLVSAYTTAMSHLGVPNYKEASILKAEEIKNWEISNFVNTYIIIKGNFKFPNNIKYPSIPCYMEKDLNTTVYPLTGDCILTGAEYILAKLQGCEITIESIINIPFKVIRKRYKTHFIEHTVKPFFSIIEDILTKRSEYPKGHILNLLYKEMGNSIYGNVVRGISDKRKFDIKTGKNLRIEASELSNPIIASWTTAFIRSVVGECLHNISKLGGKIVSVTTDGFITDVKDLESKLLNLNPESIPLFTIYREIRKLLSGNSTGLEIKHFGQGIISWTTRGQLGIGSNIKATTGFQSFGYTQEELILKFKEILSSKEKYFEFTQFSLRGANEIYKQGGHVTMKYKDQIFRLFYDNRRDILEPRNLSCEAGVANSYDFSNILLDSNPLNSVEDCSNLRFLSKFQRDKIYNKHTNKKSGNKYKNTLEIAIRNFIKAYFSKIPEFGLRGDEFLSYKELKDFIISYEPAKNFHLTRQSISNLKQRKIIFKPVPLTQETLDFITYVKSKITYFNDKDFFKS